MREPIRDKNRLEHIIEAIDTILNRTKDMTFDNLTNWQLTSIKDEIKESIRFVFYKR